MPAYRDILPTQATIERLRERERRRYETPSVADALARTARQLRKDQRSMGDLGGLWDELVPRDLAETTRLVGLARGTLTVACAGAGARYALDAWLRAGGESRLKKATRASLARVKTVLDDADNTKTYSERTP